MTSSNGTKGEELRRVDAELLRVWPGKGSHVHDGVESHLGGRTWWYVGNSIEVDVRVGVGIVDSLFLETAVVDWRLVAWRVDARGILYTK